MNNNNANRFRPWADLPTDILSNIADRLPIIQLLSFRGTCKDFRRASVDASAQIDSSRMPWILTHNPNSDDITNNCFIYNHQIPYPYRINLPDLKACMFLASYQGWLLVFKPKHRSIFFFSPFSRSKIHLPHFPYKHDLRQHATAFSHLPTSPHCIVFIGTPNEVLVISRGQTAWTRRKVPKSTITRLWPTSTIWTHAGYDHKTQTFYYFQDWEHVLKYSVRDNKVCQHPVNDVVKDIHTLPFRFTFDLFPEACTYHKRRHHTADPFHILQAGQPLNLCGCILDNSVPNSNQQLSFPNQLPKRRAINSDERWGVWILSRFSQAPPNTQW